MNVIDKEKSRELSLRQRAEAITRHMLSAEANSDRFLSPAESQKVLHELRVHQIELEMQNQTLRDAQEALEESRDRYVDLYDFAPVGYLTLTDKGMIEEINLTAATLLGVERKKLQQHIFASLVVANDRTRWMTQFLNVLNKGDKGAVEVAIKRHDGTAFHALLDCERTKVGAGDTAIRIALTDISERKRSQDALDKFFDQSANLHLIAQLDGIIRRTNRGCEITLGYGKKELKGTNFLDLVHPDDKAGTLAEMAKLAQGITTLRFENRYRHKNGEFRRLAWSGNIDAENQLIYAIASDITDQKRAEEELKRQSQRLQLATSSAALGVWDWNVSENRMEWDERMFELYGITREPSPSNLDLWTKGLHPEDRERAMAECRAALAGEKVFDTVFRVLHPDGTVKHLKANGLVIRGADGTAERMIGVNADITERNQAEDVLRESEERWKFALEGAGDGVWDWNIQAGEANYSKRWKEMLGFAESEIENNAAEWTSRVHPEDTPGVMTTIQAHIDGKTPSAVVEFRMLCKDGSWKWILGRGMVVSLDADGKPIRLIGTNTDITERKQSESALKASEEKYRALIETTGTGYLIIDTNGRVLDANQEYVRQTGHSELQDILGKPVTEWTASYESEKNLRAIALCAREGLIRNFVIDYADRNGRITPIEINATVVQDGDSQRILSVCRDITERKHAEAELIQHRNHLEELVAARTSELEQSRDAAEAGNRAKTVFLTNMSHELRTPMNGVMGMIDLVLMRATDPKQIDWLNKSKGAAQRMVNVVSDILDFSKIEAERLPLEEENFSLSHMIDDVAAMQDIIAEAKGLTLMREIPAAFPDQLSGDVFRLRQILLNLLGNACKFSDQGMITVRVSTVEQDDERILARIEVEDQGIGISPEQQAMLFQAFTQVDGSMTRKYGGTGLGLIISKRLANLMGGDVGVVSQEGHGCTFWATVRLKLTKASEAGV